MATRGELAALGMAGGLAREIGQHASTSGITPAGTTISNATSIGDASCIILASVGSGTGVKLPPPSGSPIVVIYNDDSANDLKVYGDVAATKINNIAGDTGVTLTHKKSGWFIPAGSFWIFNLSA